MCFPVFVCLCHVLPCCCPCLHPSPVPNHHPVCLSDWLLLCPVYSPCLVHLCLIVCPALTVFTCPSLSVLYIVHVPSCCCPCLHPSPVPNLPVCLYHWFHLCPVNSPCLVHLCLCLPCLDCSHLSLVICCLCVYIVLVFLFLVASS